MPYPLVNILIDLIILGLVLWIVEQIPMDAFIQRIVRVIAIVIACFWLISILMSLGTMPWPVLHR